MLLGIKRINVNFGFNWRNFYVHFVTVVWTFSVTWQCI